MGIPSRSLVGEVSDDLLCSKCSQVLEDPCTTLCGHYACRECLTESNKKRVLCQKCYKPLACSVEEDAGVATDVLDALAKLSFRCTLGCDQIIGMSQLKSHCTKECQYRLVKCVCNEEVKVRDFDSHYLTDCPCTLIECTVCKAAVPKRDMSAHQAVKRCFEKILKQERVQSARRLSGQLRSHRNLLLEQRHQTDQSERHLIRDHYQQQQSSGRLLHRTQSAGAVVTSRSIQSRVGSALVVPRYTHSLSNEAASCGKCENRFLSGRRPSARRDSHSKVRLVTL